MTSLPAPVDPTRVRSTIRDVAVGAALLAVTAAAAVTAVAGLTSAAIALGLIALGSITSISITQRVGTDRPTGLELPARRLRREALARLSHVLDLEFERCRRNERSFSIIRIAVGESGEPIDLGLESLLRVIDSVHLVGDHLYVVAPETDGAGALVLVRRMIDSGIASEETISHATFPSAGVTRSALFRALDDVEIAA